MSAPLPPSLSYEGLTCPRCAYALTGLPQARCPECGMAFDPGAVARRRRVRMSRENSLVGVALTLPASTWIVLSCLGNVWTWALHSDAPLMGMRLDITMDVLLIMPVRLVPLTLGWLLSLGTPHHARLCHRAALAAVICWIATLLVLWFV